MDIKPNAVTPVVNNDDVQGGIFIVNTVDELYLIPEKKRSPGMIAIVVGTPSIWYQLMGGIDNANWKELVFEYIPSEDIGTIEKLKNPINIDINLDISGGVNTRLDENLIIGVSNVLPLKHGGTGGNTAAAARTSLGAAAISHTTPYATTSAAGHVKIGSSLSVSSDGLVDVKYGASSNSAVQGNDARLSDARDPLAHAVPTNKYGISSAANYGHAMASSAAPLAAGTASAGTDNGKFAREGHVHPAQTVITGNAATATKLATGRTISLSGKVTGTATLFDGTANITIPVTAIDATSSDSANKWTTSRTITLSGAVTGSVSIDGSSNVTLATTLANTATAGTANTVMMRDANGRSQIAAPSAANDIANKTYVDTQDALKLSLTGGTLSGTATFANAADTSRSSVSSTAVYSPSIIAYNSRASTAGVLHHPYIRFQATRADGTNQTTATYIQAVTDFCKTPVAGTALDSALLIRSGGVLYVGGGESASNIRAAAAGATAIPAAWASFTAKIFDDNEHLFVGSDGDAYIITNANTIASSKMIKIDTGGNIVPGQNNTQNLGNASYKYANAYVTTLHGNALTATQLATARTIGGVSFNGSANINLPGVNTTGNQSTTGNAATATKLATARNITINLASTSAAAFDGTAAITPGVSGTLPISRGGTGNTTGNAATATKLATARNITVNLAATAAASFDGTANVTPGVSGTLPIARGGTGRTDGKAVAWATARTLSLTGAITGSGSIDGSGNVSIATTAAATTSVAPTDKTLAMTAAATLALITSNSNTKGVFYGTCATAGGTVEKVVSDVASNFSLIKGVIVGIKFTNKSTSATMSLNVNSTGAKSVRFVGSSNTTNRINANQLSLFQYDGSFWHLQNAVDFDTINNNCDCNCNCSTCNWCDTAN